MQSLRRSAITVARNARSSLPRQPRRYAHDAHGSEHHGPVNESFGKGFYVAVATIPATIAFYKFSSTNTDERPLFTRLIESYSDLKTYWIERNDLHTQMIEQAARDKNLFLNSKPGTHIELSFPEIFNVGSPYNVPAGSGVNLDKLITKYQKEAFEENAKKLEQLKDGTLPAEQPFDRPSKNPPYP
ncbi:hypothetical protein K432DRAFT_377935 [Lepidopterella palustris CBS 459.81]|uniref:NADH-ubiquinone oxidoreductase 17.8 kDa subunit n=1 Tax=Lepidopterella palustris CBS 459.81 TaxID=1314670 RepID=A0A8E2EJC8_9PEZI|nr:hypothetical protein K432DRAFT_377935 [Lepidopterella palustris CBS 459.81]